MEEAGGGQVTEGAAGGTGAAATATGSASGSAGGSGSGGIPDWSKVHVVLLGDSTIDNRPYVGNGPPVLKQLRAKINPAAKVTQLAVDGNVVKDVVSNQVERIPEDATHLFISVGGNDGLRNLALLSERVGSVQEAVLRLARVREKFDQGYAFMLEMVLALGLPTTIFTIYRPCYSKADPMLRLLMSGGMNEEAVSAARQTSDMQLVSNTALSALNDVIISHAVKNGLPVIDLKTMFDDEKYYANPIEPSCEGGDKLTDAILAILNEHDFKKKRCEFFH